MCPVILTQVHNGARWVGRQTGPLLAIALASLAFDTVKVSSTNFISLSNVAFAALGISVIASRVERPRLSRGERVALVVAALVVVCFLPTVFTSTDPSQALRTYVSTAGMAGVFALTVLAAETRTSLRRAAYAWVAGGIVLAVPALAQYGYWLLTGEAPNDGIVAGICGTSLVTLRVGGYTGSVNYLAFFLVPVAVASVGLAQEEHRRRMWFVAAAVVCVLGVLATDSRGAIGALVFALGAAAYLLVSSRTRRWTIRIATGVILVIGMLFIARTLVGFNEAGLIARLNIATSALRAIGVNPVVGTGLNEVPLETDVSGYCDRYEIVRTPGTAPDVFPADMAFSIGVNESFADTSRWTLRSGAAIGTASSGVLEAGDAADGRWAITLGQSTWGDGRLVATAKATDLAQGWGVEKWVDERDLVRAEWVNGSLRLVKVVDGRPTVLGTSRVGLPRDRWIWIELGANGSSYVAKVYDTGSTTAGTTKEASRLVAVTEIASISDSRFAQGSVGISSSMSRSEWGGVSSGHGGVYVEVARPETLAAATATTVPTTVATTVPTSAPTTVATTVPTVVPTSNAAGSATTVPAVVSTTVPTAAATTRAAVASTLVPVTPAPAPSAQGPSLVGSRDTHITVLEAAGTGGILGLFSYVVLVLATLWRGTRSWSRRTPFRTALVIAVLASQIVGVVVDALDIKQLYVVLGLLWSAAASDAALDGS